MIRLRYTSDTNTVKLSILIDFLFFFIYILSNPDAGRWERERNNDPELPTTSRTAVPLNPGRRVTRLQRRQVEQQEDQVSSRLCSSFLFASNVYAKNLLQTIIPRMRLSVTLNQFYHASNRVQLLLVTFAVFFF